MSAAAPALRILYLEDDPHDRELVSAAIASGGWHCSFVHASTEAEFKARLAEAELDLILSDYTLPGFNGLAALALAKTACPDVPFLFVSGTMGEERAVDAVKSGATDYVLKHHLDRLPAAARRALREAAEVTARKRAQQALARSEADLRALFAAMKDVVLVLDAHGRYLQIAPTNPGVSFKPATELIGRTLHEVFATAEADKLLELVQRALEQQQPIHAEYALRIKGSPVWFEGTFSPMPHDRVFWISRDISARMTLEAQLRQAQKMEAIGQLAGGVAHDFNNLLAVIRGNTDMALMEPERLSQQAADCLKQVVVASERAAGLVRQLLVFSRKQAMQPERLLLNAIISNLAKMLQRIIGEHIHLQCDYAQDLPHILADAGMMEQVLVNLVVNARDAMPKGGSLRIITEGIALPVTTPPENPEARPGQFVCLTVQDTGSGIAPEHLPHIFEPFFTTKELGKGTGLGLATVYGIVKQHQGWLEVYSRPSEGATFKIFLPAVAGPGPNADRSGTESIPRGGTETVLLVEDELSVRMVSRKVLESYGYKILEAASGPEALLLWSTHAGQVALLLTDLVLPQGLNGRELAQQLQRQKPALKIVLMSGYSPDFAGKDTEFIRRTRSHFLQKPFSSKALLQTVRQCLDS